MTQISPLQAESLGQQRNAEPLLLSKGAARRFSFVKALWRFVLSSVFDGLNLTQEVHLDLSGVFHLVLDTLGDLAG